MLNLEWPPQVNYNYGVNNFGRLQNLLRITTLNVNDFKEYCRRGSFIIPNQHILVGLLQNLSIDPTWELEHVVSYTKYRAYSLCTLFGITSLNQAGKVINDGFYREGTSERWILMEGDRSYHEEEKINLDESRALIPLYSTSTIRSYKPVGLRTGNDKDGEIAVMGLDLVDLAVGWWKFMRDGQEVGTGISGYLNKYVLPNTQLFANQLSVFNCIHSIFTKGLKPSDVVKSEKVLFTNIDENKVLREYIEFSIINFTRNRLVNLSNLLTILPGLYRVDYTNFIQRTENGRLTHTSWLWEMNIVKMYEVYLTIANMGGYRAQDINVYFDRVYPIAKRNIQRVQDRLFRDTALDNLNRVKELNDKNFK